MKVDFLAINEAGTVLPIQVTSDMEKAATRRIKIRKRYPLVGGKHAVGVIHMLHRNNTPADDTCLTKWLFQQMEGTAPITI